ncbi:MAG: hypothetical protein DI598_14200 [Pseudopedobacter saltans]|uniref:Replication-associated protein G2P N-terminal domain-containing protein n=1 Tax=Pseudopedobacter saltans TaxID=151895 RepID=A0A2W5ERX3_9SPHI|nr:MAG: hypothetical protein DI598_14200 [Pseudopedobacter saltans]
MKFKVSENLLVLGGFSLNKWKFGNNMQTMRLIDIKHSLEEIGNIFRLPIDKAKVVSMEFGRCIIMDYKPKLYFEYLHSNSRYTRLEEPSSLYYKTCKKVLYFYDKTKEMKNRRKKMKIPLEYQDKNVIRYEIRYLKELAKQFNEAVITASKLWDEQFFKKLVYNWESEYLNIQKKPIVDFETINFTTKSGLRNFLGVIAIDKLGANALVKDIRERESIGLLTKKQAHDLIVCIDECMKVELKRSGNDLIEELDEKVREAALCWN